MSATIDRVVTFGETMALITNERPGPLSSRPALSLSIGGAESNVAIGLRRLGTPVTWIGRVGRDSLGELVERELAAEGVDTVIVRDPHAPTGLMIKERRLPDRQQVWYYRRDSAGSRLQPADLPLELIGPRSLLHLTGITPALSPSAAVTVQAAVRRAREVGATVSLDLNYRSALWSRAEAAPKLRELITMADVVFAGSDEATLALGDDPQDPLDLARALSLLGPGQVIIKLGSEGCLAFVDGAVHRRPAVPVQPVDTVGAGDAFVAGYLSELAAGSAVAARLDLALQTGAFACLSPGDADGLPRRADLALLDAAEPVLR